MTCFELGRFYRQLQDRQAQEEAAQREEEAQKRQEELDRRKMEIKQMEAPGLELRIEIFFTK